MILDKAEGQNLFQPRVHAGTISGAFHLVRPSLLLIDVNLI